ncbi:HAD family hydrolase [Mycoplasma sp. ATU-Cv-508]|uniref:Cof-type HAD-IIB family hydrolase n=1 Tax=Mycoplasma sp. ATU-Cv-508 TaxID=2048001 RepID=UPI000FDEC298
MRKYFVFDIDGTLLNSQREINVSTVKALVKAREKGHKIVFCSGRPYANLRNLFSQRQLVDYLVCNNGSYIYDVDQQKFYFKKSLPAQVVREALEIAGPHCPLVTLHTNKAPYRGIVCAQPLRPPWFEQVFQVEKAVFQSNYELNQNDLLTKAEQEKVMQVAFRLDEHNAEKLAKELGANLSQQASIAIANQTYVDLNPPGVNKKTGLDDLCALVGCQVEKMIAFGDSDNDLEMLQAVNNSFAMSNGTTRAKAIAKTIIGDNDSDAIATKILEIIG